MKKNKIVATDIDGCVLDWHEGFISWVKEKYYWELNTRSKKDSYDMQSWFKGGMSEDDFKALVNEYNNYPRVLKPIDGAYKALRGIKELGYNIYAITAFNSCPRQSNFRKEYLNVLFPDIFDDIIVLGLGQCKRESLKTMNPVIFIEDCVTHADTALDLGIQSLIFKRSYNSGSRAKYINNWDDVLTEVKRRDEYGL